MTGTGGGVVEEFFSGFFVYFIIKGYEKQQISFKYGYL